jgi:transposase
LAKEAPRSAIHLEPRPPYAPELNPDEGGWNHLKNVERRNLCCPNPRRLRFELDGGLAWPRQRPYLIQSFFAEAGLQL